MTEKSKGESGKSEAFAAENSSRGEKTKFEWTSKFYDNSQVEKNALQAPGKIDGAEGREYAALNMIKNDLEFARACFDEARKLGIPDSGNTLSRALIYSAVVAYARPFKTGVREVKLSEEDFAELRNAFDSDLHNYLVDVRDKHVAHSVNEFENCQATTLMVSSGDQKTWRVAGVGFTFNSTIGLNAEIVERAITQISEMTTWVAKSMDTKGKALYEAQRALFAKEGKWEAAPVATFPSRVNVSKARS